jgi:hypothetical protein
MNNENIIEMISELGKEPDVQEYLTGLGAIQFSDENIDSDILFNTFEQ